jgi:hypothetical protein
VRLPVSGPTRGRLSDINGSPSVREPLVENDPRMESDPPPYATSATAPTNWALYRFAYAPPRASSST